LFYNIHSGVPDLFHNGLSLVLSEWCHKLTIRRSWNSLGLTIWPENFWMIYCKCEFPSSFMTQYMKQEKRYSGARIINWTVRHTSTRQIHLHMPQTIQNMLYEVCSVTKYYQTVYIMKIQIFWGVTQSWPINSYWNLGIVYQWTLHNIPEESNVHQHCCENVSYHSMPIMILESMCLTSSTKEMLLSCEMWHCVIWASHPWRWYLHRVSATRTTYHINYKIYTNWL